MPLADLHDYIHISKVRSKIRISISYLLYTSTIFKWCIVLVCTGEPPTVTITASPIDSDYFTGLRLTLTCSIQIPLELSSLPIIVSAQWTKFGSALVTNSRVTVGEIPVRVGLNVYQVSLVFSSLDRTSGDEGNYTCTGNVALSGTRISTASTTTNIAIASE